MKNTAIAGIDIGGTKIVVALANDEGEVLTRFRFPTHIETGPQRILDEVATELERLAREAGVAISAIGVGCAGPLDRRRGVILSPPNLPGWDEFPLTELLQQRLGVPVCLDNDANAAALGEQRYGAGRELRDLVYITISTGIGGGIIINDRLVHGLGDGAGEVGHMTVWPDGPICPCGARGCLEAVCSGTSIARRAQELLSSGTASVLTKLTRVASHLTAKDVADAARAGDPAAARVWDETIRYLAIGVGNLISTLAPEAIILGGGVSMVGDQLLEPLRREVRTRVRLVPIEKIAITQASLGGDSGIYGALILGQSALAA